MQLRNPFRTTKQFRLITYKGVVTITEQTVRTIPFAKPILGETEKQAVAEVLSGNILVHGPKIKQFESAFANWVKADGAVGVSSCTAALHLSYFYLGVGRGDEVIVPAMTHVATAHAVELVGAKPIFVDAEPRTGNIDIEQIEDKITPNTKAISLVHYLGMPVDMHRICEIAERHNLFVVEDCALAVGTYFDGIHAGLHGDVGCFSFYPVKHMTTAEGGMVISKHADVLQKVERQRAFGVDRTHGERSIPGDYDVNMLGFNYRMNEIQAVIGIGQIQRLKNFLAKRKENYKILTSGLSEISEIDMLESSHDKYESSYYCHCIVLKGPLASQRAAVINRLKAKGLGTSIYYPKAVPLLLYYKNKYGFSDGSYPEAERISNNSIALPVGPHLCEEDMLYIVQIIKEVIQEVK